MSAQQVSTERPSETGSAQSEDLLAVVAATRLQGDAQPSSPSLAIGTVLSPDTDGAVFEVDISATIVRCRRSASCLVAAGEGDRVLCVLGEPGERAGKAVDGYIVQVLESASVSDADDNVSTVLTPTSGALEIRAPRVEIAATDTLRLSAPSLSAVADRLTLFAHTSLTLLGDLLSRSFKTIRTTAGFEQSVTETTSVSAQNRVTDVKGTDTARAGTLVETVESVATRRAGSQIITAESDVRIDGERIGMG